MDDKIFEMSLSIQTFANELQRACALMAAVPRPATRWDAFKLRWFPAWLLRRFPPRFTHTYDLGERFHIPRFGTRDE